MKKSSGSQPIQSRLFEGPWQWLGAGLLLLGVLAAYQPVWHAGFVWDDFELLVDKPLIKQADGWWRVWASRGIDYVPATYTTFWLEWHFFGANALGYHLDNVLLHGIDALLLWRILRRLLVPGAWLAAAIFALHPVNVESVAWIAERKNTLAMLFYACAVLWYLRFEDTEHRRWYWLAVGAFVLGIFSKTAIAPLPVVLLGLAWWRRGRIGRRDILRSLLFFAVAAASALMAIGIQHGAGSNTVRADGLASRLAGAGWAVWFYLYKAVLPLNLMFVYPRWQIDGRNVLSYLPLAALVAGLAFCWRHRATWGRSALLAAGYFLVMLLPVLGFLNIYFMRYSLVSDHWQYFAIIGPIALAAGLIRQPIVAGALLLALGGLTWHQSENYANAETLWRATIAQNPTCWLAHNNLGVELYQSGAKAEALAQYRQALEIKPDYAEALNNLGIALCDKGDISEGMACYHQSLQANPKYEKANYNLGNALAAQGRTDEAIAQYRQALALKPDYPAAHDALGNALGAKSDWTEAMAEYRRTLKESPDLAEARVGLGRALLHEGEFDEALGYLEKSAAAVPDSSERWKAAGDDLLKQGDADEAVICYRQAVEKNPANGETLANLGVAFFQKGDLKSAVASWQQALKTKPDQDNVENNLAWVLATTPDASLRDGVQAVRLAERARKLTGAGNPMVLHTLAAAYAEVGRYEDAAETARGALELAAAQKNGDLTTKLPREIKLYESHAPLRDVPQ